MIFLYFDIYLMAAHSWNRYVYMADIFGSLMILLYIIIIVKLPLSLLEESSSRRYYTQKHKMSRVMPLLGD